MQIAGPLVARGRVESEWHVFRVGESLNQVPFAMDAVVISHSVPGELAANHKSSDLKAPPSQA